MDTSYIDPIAFQLGPITVYWYGIIIATAITIGLILGQQEAKRRGLDPEVILDLLIWGLPAALIGLRVYYVIFSWSYFSTHPLEIFAIWQGGLAIHGGIIGGVAAGFLFARYHDYSFPQLADISAPSFILGQAIGRWGNFINQEAYGSPVTREFLDSLYLPDWIIKQMEIAGTYYHPTFLYESIWNLLIFLFLTLYWKKQDFLQPGDLFLTYISLYSVGRYFIEDLRTDSLMLGSWQVARIISILIIIASLSLAVYRHRLIEVPKGGRRDE